MEVVQLRFILIATLVVLVGRAPAEAQFLEDFEERLWGVQVSFTPEWRSEELGGDLLGLQRFDMSGSDFTVGFARGAHAVGALGDYRSCGNDGRMRRSAAIPSVTN